MLLCALLAAPAAAAQAPPAYRDASRPVDERVRDLLGRMTLEEKFWQLFMIPGDPGDPSHDYSHGIFGLQIRPAETARINTIQRYFVERTRLGIPIIPFEEAVHGLMAPGATVFPAAIALAASFDTTLVHDVAGAIARDARARGIRMVLSPVVNIATDVRWGRAEETYGEDPLLVSRMGDAFVAAFESAGIVTTPKHFVANVGEGGRDSYPIDISERALREIHFPPFESAIRGAGARAVMTAYNSVGGIPATQNRYLLTDVLRGEWGFRGFVISDAAATGGATVLQMTEPNTPTAAKHGWEAGLDVVFQSSWPQHRPYWEAVRTGLVAEPVIDSAVARVLRVKFELGLFEHPYADSVSAGGQALARIAAERSMVLLKNDRATLPLRQTTNVAVIGRDAIEARMGGYSAASQSPGSILDAIRTMSRGRVTYAPGPERVDRAVETIPVALRGEYFDNITLAGSPVLVRTDSVMSFGWTLSGPGRGLSRDWYSVRWTGSLTVPAGAARRIGIEGSDGWRLFIDGRIAVDNWIKRSSRRVMTATALAPGAHDIRLEYFETTGNAHLRLVWDSGDGEAWRGAIDSAVAIVRRSDVAIVVAGIEEGEFRDRSRLGLPGHQEELIDAVAGTGKPVVVVLIGGSAISMPWLDRVAAVVDAWYPGEAGDGALAEIMFGVVNPSGHLPITFPIAEGQLPLVYNHKPTGRGDDYLDLTGQPLFPFGFGLSYTTFEYSDLLITPDTMDQGGRVLVRCRVRNTGNREGDEVVQLYLKDLLASVARPVIELKAFRRVHLEPGQETEVAFLLGTDALRMLDRDLHWVVEAGDFRVLVGSSSRDIRLRGTLTIR